MQTTATSVSISHVDRYQRRRARSRLFVRPVHHHRRL